MPSLTLQRRAGDACLHARAMGERSDTPHHDPTENSDLGYASNIHTSRIGRLQLPRYQGLEHLHILIWSRKEEWCDKRSTPLDYCSTA
jgi:hypothetical protein